MAMMIPDYALVAEVMLFSEGFEESKRLSRKMVKLYKLASEQLSQQVWSGLSKLLDVHPALKQLCNGSEACGQHCGIFLAVITSTQFLSWKWVIMQEWCGVQRGCGRPKGSCSFVLQPGASGRNIGYMVTGGSGAPSLSLAVPG